MSMTDDQNRRSLENLKLANRNYFVMPKKGSAWNSPNFPGNQPFNINRKKKGE